MLTYGKPSNWTEDTYLMNTNGDGGGLSSISFGGEGGLLGKSNTQYPQEVVISCYRKQGRVRGSLSGNITLNIQSEWQELFSGGIAAMSGSLLGAANKLTQWGLGATIQQPWMNRKIYKNTKPFSFNLPMNFVAIENAIEDVAKPLLALTSFCYPRVYSTGENMPKQETNEFKESKSARGFVADLGKDERFQGIVSNVASAVSDKESLTGTILDAFKVWEIPGPSLLASTEKTGNEHQGDAVDIVIGNIFNLGNCYLEGVNITLGSSFDNNGCPLSAHAEVRCTCADSVVCSSSGNFLVNNINDQAGSLSAIIGKASEVGGNLVERINQLLGMYKGYYSGSLNVQEAK